MTSADAVVLGAGPAGLGAALRLARTGRSVLVVERAGRVGGLTASVEVGGQRVDIGSHRLHPSIDPEILSLLRSLLGADLQERRRNGRIRLFDRWLAFPLRAGDLARSLPPGFLVRAGTSALAASVRRSRDATFADYVSTGLGRVMGEEFYFPYARKIWGVEPDELSGVQARRRISADSAARLVRKVIAPPGLASGKPGRFYYPAGGFGRISEVLADAAVDSGAELSLGRSVATVRPSADGVTVGTDDGGQVQAATVLSTLPLTTFAAALDPAVVTPPRPLRYRAMLVVYLVLDVAQYTPFDAHYLPGVQTPVTRISEPGNYRTPTVRWPDPVDTTVLCAELPCTVGDALWESSDDDLAAIVLDGLEGSALPQARVVDRVVLRRANAYPIYGIGYEEALVPLLDDVAHRPRVLTFGRQGLFAHDNTHHALAMALAAADVVRPDGGIDTRGWTRALDRFASHVVED